MKMRKIREAIRNKLANSPGFSGMSLYGVIHYPFEAFVFYPYRAAKHFIQRGARGYADCDTWDLDYYLSGWMPAAIRHLLKSKPGVPLDFIEHENMTAEEFEAAREEWHNVVEKIAEGFEASRKLQDDPLVENYEELMRITDEGLALFAKHFHSLWS